MSTDLQALLDRIPAIEAYRLRVETIPDGVRVTGDLQPQTAVYRGMPHAHGGVVASVLDTTATFAVLATGVRWVTVDLRVDYLRPTPLGPITCSGRVVSRGGRLSLVHAQLGPADDSPTALAVATMYRTGAQVGP